jgi:hypothetical protein
VVQFSIATQQAAWRAEMAPEQQVPTQQGIADPAFQRFLAQLIGPADGGDDEVYANIPAPLMPAGEAVLA